MTRTFIVEIPDENIPAFESFVGVLGAKVTAHADNFNARTFVRNFHLPVNWGTWDENGKFHGSTNYSGHATRAVLTLEPR